MAEVLGNALLMALIWMLAANAAAMGPNRFKVAALVVLLISAGWLIPAVIVQSGWLIGVPVVALMAIQLRWTLYFILRLARRYGLIAEAGE